MATTKDQSPDRGPEGTPRRAGLWQVPVFFLGIAALAGVWFVRPLLCTSAAQRFEADLTQARQLLSRGDGDAELALKLARRALDAADQWPERAGEAALLAGTAYIRLAERTEGSRAQENWQQAREYLEQADAAGVPDDDQVSLTYRLGKVGLHTGDDLERVIRRLEESAHKADNRAEAYSLLVQAYLRKPRPDLEKALEANQKLRNVPEAGDADLAAAQLQGGELLLRLNRPDEARKSLENIRDRAPAGVLLKARLLRARSYQEQRQWGDAARLYQAALADERVAMPEPARVYYNLGLCYRQLDQPQEAARAWQECVRLARGEEGPAAALVLAELRLLEPAYERVLETLTQAVKTIRKPEDWNNPLMGLKRAREVFERAATLFRQAGRHDLASKLLEPYTRLAAPSRALVLKAEICADWARVRLEDAANSKTPDDDKRAAVQLHRQAAEAYAKAAEDISLEALTRANHLWASAIQYTACQDHKKATKALETCVETYAKLDVPAEKLSEAWYRLAESYRHENNASGVVTAFRECLKFETKYTFMARYHLAMASAAAGDLDDAEAALVMNLKVLRWERQSEAQSRSLFALGHLLYQKRHYRRVVRYLEDALAKYKDKPEAYRARFELADSYRQIAAQENQSFLLGSPMAEASRTHFQNEHRRWLRKAATEFDALDQALELPVVKEQLTAEQRSQVPFVTAKCWFNLGDYSKALKIYERLIEQMSGKVEGLEALGGAVSCHAALGEKDKVRQRLLQIDTALPSMPQRVQKPWSAWVAEARKGLNDLKDER